MRKHISWFLVCAVTVVLAMAFAYFFSKAVSVMAETHIESRMHTVVIDAGHGGPDGGAVSCTGRLESEYNLEIALRANDLFQLLGYKTKMVRMTDRSVYTEGSTIASKKISDLKERVSIVNQTPNAILLSIHQNYFPDSRYSGPVVLYANEPESKSLAETLQNNLTAVMQPTTRRQIKAAEGIYLMKHIHVPGILVECGFLSNPTEEANLRTAFYQKKLVSVLVCSVANYIASTEMT